MLVVDRIARSFGNVRAVRDVSFSVERGSIFGLLGPNGAGKTTTMRTILGIYAPDSGSVTWDGAPIDLELRRRFGYLPEERGLYGKMKVKEQIVYFARMHGLGAKLASTRADEWMERLAVTPYATRACGELSKGNQQKVQLACAVLHEPELLVLDEPFSGLDPVNAETMLSCLRDLCSEGTTLILSSHQMFQIEDACSAFCVVAAGEVRARGTLAELRAAFPTRTLRVSPDVPEIRAVFSTAGADEPARNGSGELSYVMDASTDFGALLRAAVAAGPLQTFERREPTLGAIYLRAIGETNGLVAR
jgi:ABC-2 type transport system ATP-binding protein